MQLPRNLRIPADMLRQALTHSSYASEHSEVEDNERLEFLGDAVIDLAYSEYLYTSFPHMPEGQMALARSQAVCEAALAAQARMIGLGEALLLGHGEDKTGGRDRDSVLADAFEALVGAIYLSCGWGAAKDFVITRLTQVPTRIRKDSKSQLQERLQSTSAMSPSYRVTGVWGPDHAAVFEVEVLHGEKVLGKGRGRSKKEAEQRAAGAALRTINDQLTP